MRELVCGLALACLYLAAPSSVWAQAVDKAIRQGVIESLPEAKLIKNADLRNRVYDTWALAVAQKGAKRMEDLPATQKPGAPRVRNKTRADQVRSVARLSIAYAKDTTDHFALFKVDGDEVIAAALLSSPETAQGQKAFSKIAKRIAQQANISFWDVVEREGFLADAPPSPEAYPRTAMGPRVKVDAKIRETVVKALPEARMIKDPELRERAYDAWTFSLERSVSYRRIEDVPGAGTPTWPPLRGGSQADHVRGTARLALILQREMAENFAGLGGVDVSPDDVICGGLLHDIGKAFEFDPVNQKRWKSDPRVTGYPPMRHSVYGGYVALSVGLPEEMAHIISAHSSEGNFIDKSVACVMVREGDHAFWGMAEDGDLLTGPIPRGPGAR